MSSGIAQSQALLADTDAGLRPMLEPVAAEELATADAQALAEGKAVLELQGTCDYTEARATGIILPDCTLVQTARPVSGPVNATQVLDALSVLADYHTALAAIASAQSSDEVAAQTGALMDALGGLGAGAGPDGLGKIAAAATARRDLAVATTGFLAAQYRIAALRRVVTKADPVIDRMVTAAVAYLDDMPDGLPAAQTRLLDAQEAMTRAAIAHDAAGQRRGAETLKAAFDDFERANASDPANRLLLVRKLHGDLLRRLTGPQSAADYQTTLAQIRSIIELARKGDGK